MLIFQCACDDQPQDQSDKSTDQTHFRHGWSFYILFYLSSSLFFLLPLLPAYSLVLLSITFSCTLPVRTSPFHSLSNCRNSGWSWKQHLSFTERWPGVIGRFISSCCLQGFILVITFRSVSWYTVFFFSFPSGFPPFFSPLVSQLARSPIR